MTVSKKTLEVTEKNLFEACLATNQTSFSISKNELKVNQNALTNITLTSSKSKMDMSILTYYEI